MENYILEHITCVYIEILYVFSDSGDNLLLGVVFFHYSCEKSNIRRSGDFGENTGLQVPECSAALR